MGAPLAEHRIGQRRITPFGAAEATGGALLNSSSTSAGQHSPEAAWWAAHLSLTSVTAWSGVALFCVYAFIDFVIEPRSLWQTLPLRFSAAAVCAVFALATRWVGFPRVASAMASAVAVAGAIVVAVIFFAVHRRPDLAVLAEFQVVLVMMALLPARSAVRVCAVGVVAATNAGFEFMGIAWGERAIYNGLLGAAVAMMLVVSEQAYANWTRTLELEGRLRREALVDALTHIMNRRAFFEIGEKLWMGCTRAKRPACVLLIDVDEFKAVNDSHGHAVGDELLRRLAAAFTRELRGSDLIGRYGGEEFAVMLPETGREAGLLVAERLLAAARATSVDSAAGSVGCTVSIGLATLEAEPMLLEQLLRVADDALYAAKRQGRDRVLG